MVQLPYVPTTATVSPGSIAKLHRAAQSGVDSVDRHCVAGVHRDSPPHSVRHITVRKLHADQTRPRSFGLFVTAGDNVDWYRSLKVRSLAAIATARCCTSR
jgi:hypothetical protein